MYTDAIKIAQLRADGAARKFDVNELKRNCLRSAENGKEFIFMDPLQLFLLIDRAEKLSNDLEALKNELRTIEILSGEVRRTDLKKIMDLTEKAGGTLTVAEIRALFGVE